MLYDIDYLPRGVSDGAVVVDSDGSWSRVVSWSTESLGLVDEDIRHPELGGFLWVESEVLTNRVFTVKILSLGNHASVLARRDFEF